jgi:purine-binding chemotaxis protein CheW
MVLKDASDAAVVFALGEFRFALSMAVVERVVRAVEISPVPGCPPEMLGVINLHGRLVPVYDIRTRFGLTPQEVRVSDHLVIARTADRLVAVLVDAAVDVVSASGTLVTVATEALASLGDVAGVVMQGDVIVPVQELSRCLPAGSWQTTELKLVA